MTRCRLAGFAVLLLLSSACEEHRFDPPDRAERALQAQADVDTSQFDTIRWENGDSTRALFGNEVYARKCRSCHGFLGEGDTEYGRERGVAPPSLVRPAWPDGDSVPLLRRRIFAGHPSGMPTFGMGSLTLRDIDATAYYVAHVLRPDVLGTSR